MPSKVTLSRSVTLLFTVAAPSATVMVGVESEPPLTVMLPAVVQDVPEPSSAVVVTVPPLISMLPPLALSLTPPVP